MQGRKPYLAEIGVGKKDTEVVLEWLEYLSGTFGAGGAQHVLEYYSRLGWITEDVRRELMSHLRGLSLEELNNKKYDEPGTLDGSLSSFSGTPFGVHARSLDYIAEIAGDNLEECIHTRRMAETRAGNELSAESPGLEAEMDV
jgi:archaellum component FlaD/FlaE